MINSRNSWYHNESDRYQRLCLFCILQHPYLRKDKMMSKKLITNGMIYDGLGNKPFEGAVYIEGDTIKQVWRKDGAEEPRWNVQEIDEVVDAAGKAVTPGFIDIHRHCDIKPFFGTAFGEPVLAQGLTTVVAGNCGFSMVPVPEEEDKAEEMFTFAEPIVGPAYRGIHTYKEYMEALDNMKLPVNFASMIGTGTVRCAVKGFSNTPFTEEEMEEAVRIIEEAMEEGAVGASTGIMYLPENYTTNEEFARMLKPLGKYNSVLCAHIRGEGDRMVDSVKEIIEIGRQAGCAIEVSHFKSCGMRNWRKEIYKAIDVIEEARKEGMDITCDVYPYIGGSTSLTTMVPPAFVNGDMNKALEKMGTKEGVEEFCKSLEVLYEGWDNFAVILGWDRIMIASVTKPENKKFIGKMVTEAAEEAGFDDAGAFAAWLMHEEDGNVAIINFHMCQEDVDTVTQLPYASIVSDTIYAVTDNPHPRSYGAFPRIIREYVKERHVLTLEDAVRKMTSLPAARMQLAKRGQIKEGYFADINIFDPEQVKDNATFENPVQLSSGIYRCYVNGELAWEEDHMCNDGCGRNLRRAKA